MENLTDILDQLVNDLTNPEQKLSDIFLKAKVLAFKLKNERLKKWVENEVNGYNTEEEIPKYRHISTSVYGNLVQDLTPVRIGYKNNTKLVIDFISQESYDYLTKHKLSISISQIEQLIIAGRANISLPYHFINEISQTYSNRWYVDSAWREIDPSHLTSVLNSIKSHLLDFVLEVNDASGDRDLSLIDRQNKIDEAFRNNIGSINAGTVNLNIGDKNNNLNTGNNSNSKVSQNVTNNYSTEEIGQIRDLISLIRGDLQNISDNESKDRVEVELARIEREIEKPSPMKLIINSALSVAYALLTETAGAAYSPIILGKLQMLMTM